MKLNPTYRPEFSFDGSEPPSKRKAQESHEEESSVKGTPESAKLVWMLCMVWTLVVTMTLASFMIWKDWPLLRVEMNAIFLLLPAFIVSYAFEKIAD